MHEFNTYSSLWKKPDEIYEEDEIGSDDEEEEASFEVVVSEMVTTSYDVGHPTRSLAVEIVSYKLSLNKVYYLFTDLLIYTC